MNRIAVCEKCVLTSSNVKIYRNTNTATYQDSHQPSDVEKLSTFCLSIQTETLPTEAKHEARRAILDFLASLMLGSRTFHYRALDKENGLAENTATSMAGGKPGKVFYREAMIHNACLSQAFDANDGHTKAASHRALGHPGRTVIPAVLAEAEAHKKKLQDVLPAIVAGYEFGCRTIPSVQPCNMEATGALAALAHIRGIDAECLMAALGLVLPLSPQTIPVGWAKRTDHNFLRCGVSLRSAFDALVWATGGFRGPDFRSAPSTKVLHFDLSDLGAKYCIMERYSKPFPSCRMTHGPIESALVLRADPRFRFEDVKNITVFLIPGAQYVDNPHIESDPKKRAFSLQACVAIALKHGELSPRILNIQSDASLEDLANHITIKTDPSFMEIYPAKGRPSFVEIKMKSGDTLQHYLEIPKGEPANPETDEELLIRFENYSEGVLSRSHANTLGQWILSAHEQSDLSEFQKILFA